MEREVGPSIISIFEFLLSDHHAQSSQQDLFRRSTFLNHGNHSLSTLKTQYFTVQTYPPPLLISLPSDPKTYISQKRAPIGEHYPTLPLRKLITDQTRCHDNIKISIFVHSSFIFHYP